MYICRYHRHVWTIDDYWIRWIKKVMAFQTWATFFFDCKVERTLSTVYLYITFMVTCCYLSHPLILPRIPRLSKCMVAMSGASDVFGGRCRRPRWCQWSHFPPGIFFGWEQLKRVDGFPVLKQGKHQINHLYKPMIIFFYMFLFIKTICHSKRKSSSF